jgi:Flp pilus assembly protein TadG
MSRGCVMKSHLKSHLRSERGSALVEAAMTIPLLLLLMVGIFEVGRLYQTWQVVTNAAREGARVAILPNTTAATVTSIVQSYMTNGALSNASTATVSVNQAASYVVNGANVAASLVTVDYPYNFMVLQPVARLVVPTTTNGQSFTMRATAIMRNEQ